MEHGYGDHFYAEERERVDISIANLYKEQPVLFHPRTEWPRSAKKPPNAHDASFLDDYSDLSTIGWFIGHSDKWPMHVLHVHSFFYRLREREWATGGGMLAMLRVITRGLEDIVAVVPSEMTIRGDVAPKVFTKKSNDMGIDEDQECVGGVPPLGGTAHKAFFTRSLHGRRFWVFLINFSAQESIEEGKHWALGLFDRRTGVLWFFDSMAGNRKARARAVGLMWRLFLNNIGLLFNFLLVVPEVTPQDDGWSCGYITLVNALLMIRGCVGQSLRNMTNTCRLDEIPVDGCTVHRPHDYFPLEKSDILYLDWCGIGETRSKAATFMLSALKHMAANELGLIRGMLRGDDGPGTPAVDLRPYSSRAKIAAMQPGLSAIGGPIPFKTKLNPREYAERIFDNPPSTECWVWPTAAQMPLLVEFARPLPKDLPARRFEEKALPCHLEAGCAGLSSAPELPSVVPLEKTTPLSASLHKVDSRAEENDRILRKLEQCYSIPANDPSSLWHRKMETLKKMLPGNKDISFACIGTTRDEHHCDIFCLSNDNLNKLLEEGKPLTKPMLVKAGYNKKHHLGLTGRLRDCVAPGARVQVGDPRSHERLPRPVAVEDVISAIEGKSKLCGDLPFTMLDVISLPASPPLPDFLQCRRFEVIQLLGSRLRTEFAGAGKPRTTIAIQGRALDLSSSSASSLFAQDGAFTGMHRDVLPSWILNNGSEAVGSKVVFFPAPGANMLEFEEQGEDWAPEVRAVILEAGDYLIMPTPVPHAVLTMGDRWMCSGMFIDLYNILPWMDSLIYTAKNGNTTNEPIPLELISGWHHLEALFMEHIRRSKPEEESDQIAVFMERERVLRGLLSCLCKGKCADKCKSYCRCKKSAFFDGKCGPWCHLASRETTSGMAGILLYK